jgi:hypothetical protein
MSLTILSIAYVTSHGDTSGARIIVTSNLLVVEVAIRDLYIAPSFSSQAGPGRGILGLMVVVGVPHSRLGCPRQPTAGGARVGRDTTSVSRVDRGVEGRWVG